MIDNILLFLKLAAKKFNDKDEYNCYKHGLRIISGTSNIEIRQNNSTNVKELGIHQMLLYPEKGKNPSKLLLKSYDYEKDFDIIKLASNLVNALILQRRKKIENDTSGFKIRGFKSINIKKIFESDFPVFELETNK